MKLEGKPIKRSPQILGDTFKYRKRRMHQLSAAPASAESEWRSGERAGAADLGRERRLPAIGHDAVYAGSLRVDDAAVFLDRLDLDVVAGEERDHVFPHSILAGRVEPRLVEGVLLRRRGAGTRAQSNHRASQRPGVPRHRPSPRNPLPPLP